METNFEFLVSWFTQWIRGLCRQGHWAERVDEADGRTSALTVDHEEWMCGQAGRWADMRLCRWEGGRAHRVVEVDKHGYSAFRRCEKKYGFMDGIMRF